MKYGGAANLVLTQISKRPGFTRLLGKVPSSIAISAYIRINARAGC